MTLLERLKELAKLCERMEGESVGAWADRWHEENAYVRKQALPLLLELAEAVIELTAVARLREDDVLPKPEDDTKLWTARMQSAWNDIDTVLAKLEAQEGGGE